MLNFTFTSSSSSSSYIRSSFSHLNVIFDYKKIVQRKTPKVMQNIHSFAYCWIESICVLVSFVFFTFHLDWNWVVRVNYMSAICEKSTKEIEILSARVSYTIYMFWLQFMIAWTIQSKSHNVNVECLMFSLLLLLMLIILYDIPNEIKSIEMYEEWCVYVRMCGCLHCHFIEYILLIHTDTRSLRIDFIYYIYL